MITTAAAPSSPASQRRDSLQQGTIGGSFIHSHGTKVFVPNRIDDVQDAVNQARFSERKWVWVQDDNEAYISAHVLKENNRGKVEVELQNGRTCLVPSDKIYPMNPPKFDRVEDMAELTHLNEPSVIHNLTLRYHAGEIYTYSGLFLVAINPYRKLSIYSQDYVQTYKGRRRGELPPHIYAVADQVYHDMVQDRKDQSILITGESGAGKTENTKIVIQYLAAVANNRTASGEATQLAHQILQANPILEAFGNAQTVRNNNSSRFGKFIRINFDTRAQICGANIEWYLLEKSRVHQQSIKERNYHVFYQLLNADGIFKQKLGLGNTSDYTYTKKSKMTIEGVDDAEEFRRLLNAFKIMGLSDKEVMNLFSIVAAVLHLGNIVVHADSRGEQANVRELQAMECASNLLGISPQEFKSSLLKPRIKAGRELVTQSKSADQVRASLDALAKALYERNFSSLVDRINLALRGEKYTTETTRFIGVLDIAGFEIYEVNSFEQLCINYTNEKLQQFFNHRMFALEQEEYQKENIDWSYIDFGLDLQGTIDLIERPKPRGILSCLEEECLLQGSDKRFLAKLNEVWGNEDPKYSPLRFKEGFVIKHYAGSVEYSTVGWIDKNKDPLNEDIARLLARSTEPHVARLFEEYLTDGNEQPLFSASAATISGKLDNASMKLRKGAGSFQTVGQRHKQQLLTLMRTLDGTHPHFVRCMLPNNRKRPNEIQAKLVLNQLRCNGVLEGIRICRKGFPNRLSFDDFRERYGILQSKTAQTLENGGALGVSFARSSRLACQALLEAIGIDPERYRIGATKVFFKATVLAELEEIRDKHLTEHMTKLQAMCRRYIARQRISRKARQTEAVRVMQRNARIYVTLREWPWWKLYAKLRSVGAAYQTETQIRERDQKIQQQKVQLEDKTAQLEELERQIEQHRKEHQTMVQGPLRELREHNQTLVEKLASAEERVEALAQAVDSSQQENAAQAAMIMRLHQDIKECSEDNETLSNQYQQLKSVNETLSARVEYLENETAREHNEMIEQLKRQIQQMEEASELYLVEWHWGMSCPWPQNVDSLPPVLTDLQEKRATNERLAKSEEERKELMQQVSALQSNNQQLESVNHSLKTDSDALHANWKQLASILQAEAADARARSERFEQMVSKFGLHA
ncbi:P-loop containing nucleoside triphosphate hydrolase protein [Dichotomocladium elegans]|nr:P-loop containing nucleoside triphosphate hydrolase protein [Dichotomocladium elegans]